jgi:hypothetical protein
MMLRGSGVTTIWEFLARRALAKCPSMPKEDYFARSFLEIRHCKIRMHSSSRWTELSWISDVQFSILTVVLFDTPSALWVSIGHMRLA